MIYVLVANTTPGEFEQGSDCGEAEVKRRTI
jgi:hypothetical protein